MPLVAQTCRATKWATLWGQASNSLQIQILSKSLYGGAIAVAYPLASLWEGQISAAGLVSGGRGTQ